MHFFIHPQFTAFRMYKAKENQEIVLNIGVQKEKQGMQKSFTKRSNEKFEFNLYCI